jgi:hypothetical protein
MANETGEAFDTKWEIEKFIEDIGRTTSET